MRAKDNYASDRALALQGIAERKQRIGEEQELHMVITQHINMLEKLTKLSSIRECDTALRHWSQKIGCFPHQLTVPMPVLIFIVWSKQQKRMD